MSFLRIHTRLTPLLSAMALALGGFLMSAHAVEPNNADILGTWKLIKVLDSADITSMNDKEAAHLVGKTLVVKTSGIAIAGEICSAADFERHQEPAAKYVRENYHAPVGRLGLPNIITVVDLRCTEALVKAPDKIVVFWAGFFFDAIKQVPAGPLQPDPQ